MNKEMNFYYEYDAAERTGIASFLTRSLRELVIYRYAIYNFVNTNLSTRYRRSAIGFFWSLLNPLFTMIILSFVFSGFFKNSLANFSIYMFSGLLPWTLMLNSILNGTQSMVSAERYLKKVYVPKIIFPIVVVSGEVVNFLLSLISLFVVAVFLGAQISWALLTLPLALLVTVLFLLGLAMMVSTINVYFRDTTHIIQVFFTGLFYLTPILYSVDFIPNTSPLLLIIKLNPFAHFIDLFHSIIYRAQFPDLTSWLICCALTLTSLIVGLFIFSASEKDIIYRL
jgi:ABC-2 type transport system permease protein/lipopolysaccharide transport system permease protein